MGCSAQFDDKHNPPGACVYHPGQPLFHDGAKVWSCCQKRSHDFSLFLTLPGCARGQHTHIKQHVAPAPSPNAPPANSQQLQWHPSPLAAQPTQPRSAPGARKDCTRCTNGFFCADHGVGQPSAAPGQSLSLAASLLSQL